MGRAYDHVHWDFLVSVMHLMGFGVKWCKWIKAYISSVSFAIMVDWSSHGFFRSSRGLRHGDPLSLLSISSWECLVASCSKLSLDLIQGCCLGPSSPSIPLIQFVDDSFFLKVTASQFRNLRSLLLMFEASSSGLIINLQKSKLVKIGHVPSMVRLAHPKGFQVAALLVT